MIKKIQKEEEVSSKSEETIEDMKKNIDIKSSVNENYLENWLNEIVIKFIIII